MDDRWLDSDILYLTEIDCEAGSETWIIESALQKIYHAF